ncbi:MAG: hypothetical protein LBQ42_08435 [Synergistaceae bacterium]|nr:hypothetical protein [Synergistaceae bacterium]
MNISEAAKRLRFHSGDAAKLGERLAAANGDPALELMDKSLSQVEEILDEMKALAVAVQGEKLTKLDRIEMQIKMEDLREELRKTASEAHMKLADMLGVEGEAPLPLDALKGVALIEGSSALPGEDERSLFERARDRITKGEEWDAAESCEIFNELKKVRVGDREIQVETGEIFELPSDIDSSAAVMLNFGERVGGGWLVLSNDKDAPTVRQKLEASDTIILMDAKSAKEGVKRLETEINDLKQAHEKLIAFSQQYKPEPEKEANADISKTPKGSMFERVKRLFKQIVNSITAGAVSEAASGWIQPTWTNWNGSGQQLRSEFSLDAQISLNMGIAESPGTPKVHTIYNDAGNRLSSINGFFEYDRFSEVVVYKAIPRVNAVYFEAKISQSWSYERFF